MNGLIIYLIGVGISIFFCTLMMRHQLFIEKKDLKVSDFIIAFYVSIFSFVGAILVVMAYISDFIERHGISKHTIIIKAKR